MGAETAVALGIATLVAGAAYGASEYTRQRSQSRSFSPPKVKSAKLTDDEAKKAAGSKAYRAASYFSTPVGVLNTASRRGSRLSGQ